MPLSTALEKAEPFIVGIGVPLLGVALSIILPVQFAQQSTIGGINAKIDDTRNDLARISAKIDQVGERLTEKETDPTK